MKIFLSLIIIFHPLMALSEYESKYRIDQTKLKLSMHKGETIDVKKQLTSYHLHLPVNQEISNYKYMYIGVHKAERTNRKIKLSFKINHLVFKTLEEDFIKPSFYKIDLPISDRNKIIIESNKSIYIYQIRLVK